jgi:hypothetical protein
MLRSTQAHPGGRAARRLLLAALGLLHFATSAQELRGDKHISLHARDGSTVVIGQVLFTRQDDGRSRFKLQMDPAPFTDHFLSMREFKCLGGGSEILCHVPYPYPQPGTVAAGDLAWLEHSLLFMFKKPGEFGARLWNGVYWQLRATPQGLEGRPQAVDLNFIGAPPARTDVPPFRPALRDDMPEGSRWFHRLTIE